MSAPARRARRGLNMSLMHERRRRAAALLVAAVATTGLAGAAIAATAALAGGGGKNAATAAPARDGAQRTAVSARLRLLDRRLAHRLARRRRQSSGSAPDARGALRGLWAASDGGRHRQLEGARGGPAQRPRDRRHGGNDSGH